MNIFFVFAPSVLVSIGWLPFGAGRDLGACIAKGYCLFHPAMGPAFGAGIGLALSALHNSDRWYQFLAPHISAGKIVQWRLTVGRAIRLSAAYSLGSMVLLYGTTALFIAEWNFPIMRALGETTTIYIGNIGVIAGILLGQLMMRVGIVIPPRAN